MTLAEHTSALKTAGRKALVPFFTAGYPDEGVFVDCVRAAAEAGADAVEIGAPFSDPMADGPAIQAASTAALAGGMTLSRALGLAGEVSERISIPLILMSYVNPILALGLERFAAEAAGAGVSGAILPDVSWEESAPFRRAFASGISYIHLLAPTSSDERVDAIARDAAGFLYLVSLTGVTGARDSLPELLPTFVARARARTDTPLYVGFGVSTPAHAAAVTRVADGVIIGSRLIGLIDDGEAAGAASRVGTFLAGVREAIDNSRET